MKQFYIIFWSITAISLGLLIPGNEEIDNYLLRKNKKEDNKSEYHNKRGRLVLKSQKKNAQALLAPTLSVSKTVAVNGGGNATVSSILNYTIDIVNNGTDAENVTFTDALVADLSLVPGSVKATPIAANDSYTSIGNVGITVDASNGLLANDISPDNTNISITSVTDANTTDGGKITINSNGSFVYYPKTGTTATSDSYTYTLNSENGTNSTGTVTFTISGIIWFINNTVDQNGDGSLSKPFKQWSDFGSVNNGTGLNPKDNHTIFIYSGSGDYTGAVTLRSGQKIIGQGSSESLATFASITVPQFSNSLPPVNLTRPNLISSGNTITLSSGNNTLRGFNLGNSTKDIVGSSFGTLTLNQIEFTGDGQVLDLTNGALSANIIGIASTNSASTALNLNTITGSMTVNDGTTITNPNGSGISITGTSTINCNFGNTTLNQSSSTALVLNSTSSQSNTFGSLNISPDANVAAINSSSSGTLTCTSGTILTSGVTGAVIGNSNTSTVGTLSMVLTSYTASNSTVGLLIRNTSGSFSINGTSTSTGTGGSISNMSQKGIEIRSASNISLKNMNFVNANTSDGTISSATDNTGANASLYFNAVDGITLDNIQMNSSVGNANAQHGINLYNSGNFSLLNSTITRCGTTNENEACIYAVNTSGTNVISNSTLSKASRIARFSNTNINMTLRVTGSSFNDTRTFNDSNTINSEGQSGILFQGLGNSVMSLDVKSNCNFLRVATQGVNVVSEGTSNINADVKDSNFDSSNPNITVGEDVGIGVLMEATGSSLLRFNIKNNTIKGRLGNLIGLGTLPASTAKMEGTVEGNTITYHFVPSVANNTGFGIAYNHIGNNTDSKVRIHNNTLLNFNYDGAFGISSLIQGGTANVIVTNNNITHTPNGFTAASYAIRVSSTVSGATGCLRIAGNNVINNANATGYGQFRASVAGTTLNIEGSGNIADPHVSIWNNNSNTPTISSNVSPTFISSGGSGTRTLVAANTCLSPQNSTLNLRVASDETPELAINTEEISPEESISLIKQENRINEAQAIAAEPSVETSNDTQEFDYQNDQFIVAQSNSGETVTVNGTGSGFKIPAGKQTRITFSAQVSSTPSSCLITNQASVSGSNFLTVLSDNPNVAGSANSTDVNLVIPVASTINTTTASPICYGQSVSMSTSCTNGDIVWYNALTGGTELGTTTSGETFVHQPTSNITYFAACKVSGCESQRVQGASIVVNSLPEVNITVSSNSVCQNTTLDLSVPAGALNYSWSGNGVLNTNSNITTAVPLLTGDQIYGVTATTSLGCTASSQVTVNVKESPEGNPSNNSPVCEGQTLNLSSVAGMTSYSWSGPNGFSSLDQNPQILNTSTAANGTYTLVVTNSLGCSSTETTSVTINAKPQPNPSSNSPLCVNETLNLNSADGMTNYSWTGPNSFSSNIQAPSISNVQSNGGGIYTVTVTNSNGCTASSTITVTVNSLPTVEIVANEPFCEGNTLNLSTNNTFSSYSWSGPNSFSSNLANPSISNISSIQNGTYTVLVTDINGCTATANLEITVNNVPLPNAGSNSPVCTGKTLELSSTTNGLDSYSWTGPNGYSSSDQNPQITNVSTSHQGTYSLTVSNLGCTASASVIVVVNVTPTPEIVAPSSVCEGQTINLSIQSGIGDVNWVGPNGFNSNNNSTSVSNASIDNQGVYTVTVTSNACTATATASVTVTITEAPMLGSNSPLCIGQDLSLTSSLADTYSWTGPNAFNSSVQNPSRNALGLLDAGVYSIVITSGLCTASSTINVVVNDNPTASSGGGGLYCQGSNVSLTAQGGNSYAWSGPNAYSSTDQNPIITSFNSQNVGTYTVTVTDVNSCSAISTLELTIKPLPEISFSSNSPICENNELTISSTIDNANLGDVVTYNWKGPNSFSSNSQNFSITNASLLANGTYTLIVGLNSCIDSSTVDVEILAKPSAPTAGSQYVCFGGNIEVQAVCASGSSLVWYQDANGTIAISNSLTNVTQNTTIYAACERNDISSCQGVLTAINILVDNTITYIPTESEFNNLYLCQNGSGLITLNNSLTGNNFNYQWQINTGSGFTNLANNANYAGVNSDTLFLNNIPLSFQNYRYRAVISNQCGNVIGDTSTLQINILPVIVTEPVGQTVCSGNEISFETSATGTGLSYQWEINTGLGFGPVSGSNYQGFNTNKLIILNIPNGLNNAQFRCKVFNSCVTVYTQSATLVIDPTVTIITQPVSKTICQGLSTSFTVVAAHLSNGALNYQWQRKSGNVWINISNSSIYSGATGSVLTLTNVPFNLNNVEYRCLINSYCQTATAKLTVTPVASINSQPKSVTICQGNNANFVVVATGINLTYRWQVNSGSGFVNILDGGIYQGATTSNLSLSFPNNTYNGYKYRCIVTGNGPCDVNPATSMEATLTVGTSAEALVIVAVSPISNVQTYQAVQSVLGINTINSGAVVNYQAGNSVILNPGFMADSGSVFTAKIQNPCVIQNAMINIPKEIKK